MNKEEFAEKVLEIFSETEVYKVISAPMNDEQKEKYLDSAVRDYAEDAYDSGISEHEYAEYIERDFLQAHKEIVIDKTH